MGKAGDTRTSSRNGLTDSPMTHSADATSTSAPTTGPSARAWIVTIAAGLTAAMITWAAGESLMVDEIGRGSRWGRPISAVVYSTRNGVICLGILGGSLGLALGLAGGFLRGSARSVGLASLVGVVLGGAAGAGAARVLVPLYFRHYSGVDLSLPLLVHGGLWTSIAFAAGLAFGLGVGGPSRVLGAMTYAIAGALLATFTYEFASIWLFPAAQTDRPLPTSSGSRLFAYLVVALIMGAALAFGASRRQSSKVTQAPTIS
jgi:hypothetical protein